ncbi:methyltransferase domain-containing protein [Thermobifida halotolerans]|uniref:Protein-L-isoaspartate O-methyltransferase n=1 Tax=Thermobifida halotolerans TaxID=483545 RepID=A0A399G5V7_9ACTN|nr:methyltransferase domain-containing protein [Thermobifida halotolerans]UOE21048.1 methyltransferase domain-containing protein [Thermobifida halotolerans]
MTLLSAPEWRSLLLALADTLPEDVVADPAWRRAFLSVPRHVFVPGFYGDQRPRPRWIGPDDPSWLPRVYSDVSLVTQIRQHPDDPRNWWPTSSSSRPSLMLAMLHALDVADGMRVLELGTGTGYNAALLTARLGEAGVVSVDIDPALVEEARDRLARLGLHPTLAVADSTAGHRAAAPYDRVIATHSVERVPYAWVEQTRPGGVILVDIRSVGNARVGHIARLTVHADGTATGDFRAVASGSFMPARREVAVPDQRLLPARDLRDATTRASDLGGGVLADPDLAFALWVTVPDLSIVPTGPRTLVFTPDGSWASAPADPGRVQVAGERDLWHAVEEVHAAWQAAGRPRVEEYTVTVTEHGQRIEA